MCRNTDTQESKSTLELLFTRRYVIDSCERHSSEGFVKTARQRSDELYNDNTSLSTTANGNVGNIKTWGKLIATSMDLRHVNGASEEMTTPGRIQVDMLLLLLLSNELQSPLVIASLYDYCLNDAYGCNRDKKIILLFTVFFLYTAANACT